ncbi:uncharacterized protein STEHIDRAFT_155975 [Stereum hirsutum FP-91666 SS1]|uniref:uncharacterized protein n=1 Tax=Stereum hirsutum (strain FP-91666) TaxID=721885 RepID=UPI000440E3DE|nr:uncharacterized protein STEHIDRAFT_155975 [Stereum hirsutum FP-91666 SS1]EIM88625.1 hypothetical protein STEHIDRAFT_155975 [Stereum hirsutum FP-91666 SS1]
MAPPLNLVPQVQLTSHNCLEGGIPPRFPSVIFHTTTSRGPSLGVNAAELAYRGHAHFGQFLHNNFDCPLPGCSKISLHLSWPGYPDCNTVFPIDVISPKGGPATRMDIIIAIVEAITTFFQRACKHTVQAQHAQWKIAKDRDGIMVQDLWIISMNNKCGDMWQVDLNYIPSRH